MAVLVAGTILGSIVIPLLQKDIDRVQIDREQRLRLAVSMLNHNSSVNSALNILQSVLESYVKDVAGKYEGTELTAQVSRIRQRVDDCYDRFNAEAWWWSDDVRAEAITLGLLTDAESSVMQTEADRYRANLVASTKCLENVGLWSLPSTTAGVSDSMRRAVLSNRDALEALRKQRTEILRRMCAPLVDK